MVKLKKIIKIFTYSMMLILSLNMVDAVEIIPGFQYGGDMLQVGNNLYVLDNGNNQVIIFNQNDGSVINEIAVGSNPSDLLLDNNLIYVAVTGSSKIVKIDINTNTISDTYNLNIQPKSIAKKGNYLYIIDAKNPQSANFPSILDLSTKTQIGKLPNPPNNSNIYSPNFIQIIGNNLYFSETGLSSSTVYEYDVSNPVSPTFIKKSSFDDFTNIWDFKVDSNNNLYVIEARDLKITNKIFNTINSLNGISYGIYLYNNLIYTSNDFGTKLNAYDSNMQIVETYDLNGYFNSISPNGILVNSNNIFLVGDGYYNSNKLFMINKNTKQIKDLINDYSIDLKITNANITKKEGISGTNYELLLTVKNIGTNPINLNNLKINSSLYGNNVALSFSSSTLNPGSSINPTSLLLTPKNSGLETIDVNVFPVKPYFDMNILDNKKSIQYEFNLTSQNQRNNLNNPRSNLASSNTLIIDNSVNTVVIDNSVNKQVDNSVNNIGSINVASINGNNLNSQNSNNKNLVDISIENFLFSEKTIKLNKAIVLEITLKNNANSNLDTSNLIFNFNYDNFKYTNLKLDGPSFNILPSQRSIAYLTINPKEDFIGNTNFNLEVKVKSPLFEEVISNNNYVFSKEIYEKDIYKSVKSNDNVISIKDSNGSNNLNGCVKNNINYAFGVRLYEKSAKYCDVDSIFKIQKKTGETCQNNFECGSNTCGSGVCTDLSAKMDKQNDLLQQILDWLKSFFGGKN